jgi:hypothetical protein
LDRGLVGGLIGELTALATTSVEIPQRGFHGGS